jgi:hypothetical protein
LGAYPEDYNSSYKEGYWGEIGAISLILPQFHAEILAGGGGGVGRQQNLRRFWAGVIGTPVFFCFNHSCCNAARPLCIRCASTRVVLKQNSQRFFSADLSCESASHHFALFFFETGN